MNTAAKIGVFAGALALTFGAAYGVGNGVGPIGSDPGAAEHAADEDGEKKEAGAAEVGGLQVAQSGYTLDLKTPRLEAGEQGELSFAILGKDGRPLKSYQRENDKELHLILAARDLSTYRHLHPTRAADGTWSIDAELPRAGDYRVFADFVPKGGEDLTLGADLAVAGDYTPAALPAESRTAKVDGYTVTLDGDLKNGSAEELKLGVRKDGKPVTDLQPYLGSYGHLVALRAGDLAYLHVHPNGEPDDGKTKPGPEVSFTATAPSEGSYRLYLDFKHEGEVRTAAFTVTAGAGAAEETEPEKEEQKEESEEHGH